MCQLYDWNLAFQIKKTTAGPWVNKKVIFGLGWNLFSAKRLSKVFKLLRDLFWSDQKLLLLLLKQSCTIKSKGIAVTASLEKCISSRRWRQYNLKGYNSTNIKSVLFRSGSVSFSQVRPDCVNVTYWWSQSLWDLTKALKSAVPTKDYFLFTNTPIMGNCCQIQWSCKE